MDDLSWYRMVIWSYHMKTHLPCIIYLDIQVDYVRNFNDVVLFTKQVVRPRASNRVRITSQLTIFTNTCHVVPQWQSRQTNDKVPCNCMWLHQTQPICVYAWIDNIFVQSIHAVWQNQWYVKVFILVIFAMDWDGNVLTCHPFGVPATPFIINLHDTTKHKPPGIRHV